MTVSTTDESPSKSCCHTLSRICARVEHAAGVDEQAAEERVLGWRERDHHSGPGDAVRGLVHLEVGAAQHGVVVSGTASAERPLYAGHELGDCERLGDVVVAPDREAVHSVVGAVAGGEEDHRRVAAGVAQPSQHGEAVTVGQHHVEHDEIGGVGCRGGDRVAAARR